MVLPPCIYFPPKGPAFTHKETCQLVPVSAVLSALSSFFLPPSLPPSFVSQSSPVSLRAPRRNFAKMMQEVSITVAYDAHVINQINEEDFFASLVANSKPKPVVPTKKLKKFEKEYQSLRESQLQQEDPIDRYQFRTV
ncbi:uncharacterized protein rabgap1l isoform X6 [Megalobrama amblycephala]|uniref:uncharacterized protein rabgap1l isoform X6 n=2 Tax=Xenocypridinae TaxID=2743747 RepID=UPI002014046C|nr:uncharacterized protein rabgap1l isoform X6 [Megalobrama amblycephala]